MRAPWNTSTALAASLSLMMPVQVTAQSATPVPELLCADGRDLPCPAGIEALPSAQMICEDGVELPCAEGVMPAPRSAMICADGAGLPCADGVAAGVRPKMIKKLAKMRNRTVNVGSADVAAPETAPEVSAETPPTPNITTQESELAAALATETIEAVDADVGATEEAATNEPTAEPVSTAETAPAPDLPAQPEAATGEAPVAAAAQAEVEATAEVTEEVVTEETARSSDEDFANKVNETAANAAASQSKSGLSKGEKAVLLGLGAIAVGAILSNNREVALNSGDRVVVARDDGTYDVIKDDNALLRQPGSTVRTETFGDGSTRTTIARADHSQIVTIRDAEYRVLRRVHVGADGTETLLIDDTVGVDPVDFSTLPAPAKQMTLSPDAEESELRAALTRDTGFDHRYSLAQVRDIAQVRALVPVIDLNTITFETGSAAIRPDQARSLSRLGRLIKSYIIDDPREVFLIEGHTDAVGSAAYNLALSDRRAESVALALTEYFDVPPENLVVQGYGERFLKVQTELEERINRRASVRRITDLLRQASN